MILKPVKPRKALNKAWLKAKPNRTQIERFKHNMSQMFGHINETESEEHHKNLVSSFLKSTYYHDQFFINTRYREDMAIYTSKNAESPVGVIIEAKKPSNRSEMLSPGNINVKAMHELILYYMRERISGNNLAVKHLVATNIYEWFIFDARDFDKWFARNRTFVKQFTDFEEKRLSSTDTDFFYKNIAARWVESIQEEIPFTHFDLRDIKKNLLDQNPDNDSGLIPYFKIFSPEHLLKLSFANDSNTLDRGFYNELLHIIGLEETKEGSKKIIGRKAEGKRNSGSLIENAMNILGYEDCLSSVKRSDYGSAKEEQLFNVALELSITWINRILFLKLLESQLVKYHQGDKSYCFLNPERISDYDELNKLFFQVLAVRESERNDAVKAKFGNIPYLNSSLFEPNELEHKTIRISNLENEYRLPLLTGTVLTDSNGKKIKGEKNTLHYLFGFLDAYDFAGEGSEEIQEDNKTLINASVLGLIFEKINGYRDGSYFTPGFITMYMARETVRRAVVQKFNEAKGWDCRNIDDLYNRITDKPEANAIINSLKACDPAVGSGHFLVSVLNEIIALKSDLKILTDRNGRILRDYHVEVENDELVVTDEEGWLFEYRPGNPERQRIQEALFHEKQTLIENCLFGVDINPNSVKICRLRLWIELLKNAYYKTGTRELETLPNIDINIKTGNSLISRYALDSDLKKALKSSRYGVDGYRLAVQTYRNAKSREQKHAMLRLIDTIKNDFETEIASNDKRRLRLNKLKGELFAHSNQQGLFELSASQKKAFNKKSATLAANIKKLETELDAIANNKIYENAFEWRFEFPEVLNDDGDFEGFDIVIGNPPYIRQEEFSTLKPVLQTKYETYAGTADLYVYFIEHALAILRTGAEFMFIVPNKWKRAGYGKNLRKFLKMNQINTILDFGDLPVFDEATTYPCILSITKTNPNEIFEAAKIQSLDFPLGLEAYVKQHKLEVLAAELQEEGWTLSDIRVQKLLAKLRNTGTPLGEYVEGKIYRGVLTGLNEAFVIDEATKNDLIAKDSASMEIIKPFLAGRDIKKYRKPEIDKFLIFTRRGIQIEKYLAILEYLRQYKERLVPKPKDFSGKNWQGRKPGSYKWYELQDAVDYYIEFEKPRIIIPAITKNANYSFSIEPIYSNDKTSIISTDDLYLLGLLNSRLIDFYLKQIASTKQNGYFEYKPVYVNQLPICKPLQLVKNEIEGKVTQILTLKEENPQADTSALEAEIDRMVYELYGITEEEIAIIEGTESITAVYDENNQQKITAIETK